MAQCEKCGGFKNIYDRNERGKIFTQCWKCGNLTVEDDPLLQRSWREIKAAGDAMRARREMGERLVGSYGTQRRSGESDDEFLARLEERDEHCLYSRCWCNPEVTNYGQAASEARRTGRGEVRTDE